MHKIKSKSEIEVLPPPLPPPPPPPPPRGGRENTLLDGDYLRKYTGFVAVLKCRNSETSPVRSKVCSNTDTHKNDNVSAVRLMPLTFYTPGTRSEFIICVCVLLRALQPGCMRFCTLIFV